MTQPVKSLRGKITYAFGKMADIAGYAATAAFAGAGLSLVFSILGFYHASKVTRDQRWA